MAKEIGDAKGIEVANLAAGLDNLEDIVGTPKTPAAPTSPKSPKKTDHQSGTAPQTLEEIRDDADFDDPFSQPASRSSQPEGQEGKESEPSPQPQAIQHPPYLAKLAADYGISQEEIDRTPSEQLGFAVQHLSRISRSTPQQVQSVQAQGPPPPALELEEEPLDFGIDPDTGAPITERDLNPGIVNAFKAERKRLRAIERRLEEQAQFTQSQQQQSQTAMIDSAFAGLGPGYEPVLGKGGIQQIATNPRAKAFREATLQMAQQLAGPNATTNDILAMLPSAAQTLFGARNPAPGQQVAPAAGGLGAGTVQAQQNSRITADQWAQAALAGATHRQGAAEPKKGDVGALQTIQSKLRDHGYDTIIQREDERDSLPD